MAGKEEVSGLHEGRLRPEHPCEKVRHNTESGAGDGEDKPAAGLADCKGVEREKGLSGEDVNASAANCQTDACWDAPRVENTRRKTLPSKTEPLGSSGR